SGAGKAAARHPRHRPAPDRCAGLPGAQPPHRPPQLRAADHRQQADRSKLSRATPRAREVPPLRSTRPADPPARARKRAEAARAVSPHPETTATTRVVIEAVTPVVDLGRFPAKRTADDVVVVGADVFTDGHEKVAAAIL